MRVLNASANSQTRLSMAMGCHYQQLHVPRNSIATATCGRSRARMRILSLLAAIRVARSLILAVNATGFKIGARMESWPYVGGRQLKRGRLTWRVDDLR